MVKGLCSGSLRRASAWKTHNFRIFFCNPLLTCSFSLPLYKVIGPNVCVVLPSLLLATQQQQHVLVTTTNSASVYMYSCFCTWSMCCHIVGTKDDQEEWRVFLFAKAADQPRSHQISIYSLQQQRYNGSRAQALFFARSHGVCVRALFTTAGDRSTTILHGQKINTSKTWCNAMNINGQTHIVAPHISTKFTRTQQLSKNSSSVFVYSSCMHISSERLRYAFSTCDAPGTPHQPHTGGNLAPSRRITL